MSECDCQCNDPRTEGPWHSDTVVDIGSDHLIAFFHLSSDYGKDADGVVDWNNLQIPDPAGCHVYHKKSDGFWCIGSIYWRHFPSDTNPGVLWDLASLDPLTVSPSLLCHCGDHGFIKQGKWVPA